MRASAREVEERRHRFPRYPEYRRSGVEWLGEIPAHWALKRLKNCVQRMESGGTPESDNADYWTDDESGIPWVAISDMTRAFQVRDTAKRLTELGLRSKRLPILPSGTLLYSMYASLGKVAILMIDAVVNQAILGLVTRDDLASRDYLRWWLDFMQGHVQMLSSSNTQDNLNADKVRKMPVLVPGPDAQSNIATFLDRETAKIDALVAKKERLIELLQEDRTALITQAVTKGLDSRVQMKDSGVERLGEIPEHWEVCRVGAVSDCLVGFAFPSDGFRFDGNGTRLVRGDNVTTGRLRWDDKTRWWPEVTPQLRPYLLGDGDVVVGMDGSKVGRNYALVSRDDLPLLLVQRVTRLRPRPVIRSDYLLACVANPRFHAHVDTMKSDPAIPHITAKNILDFKIALPPRHEQDRIMRSLRARDRSIEVLLSRVTDGADRLREYRSALISATVTGQIDVRGEVA